jgi:hypothetical protein
MICFYVYGSLLSVEFQEYYERELSNVILSLSIRCSY